MVEKVNQPKFRYVAPNFAFLRIPPCTSTTPSAPFLLLQ